jgi:hypothetical protein
MLKLVEDFEKFNVNVLSLSAHPFVDIVAVMNNLVTTLHALVTEVACRG